MIDHVVRTKRRDEIPGLRTRSYKGVLRAQGATLALRAYVGVEVLGETEEMTRTAAPAQPCAPR